MNPGVVAPGMRAGLPVALMLALLVAGTGCGGSAAPASSSTTAAAEPSSSGENDAIAVRVAAVVSAPVSELYTTSATLRADKRATITSRTGGVLRRLLVEEGDQVVAGQALAELENEEQTIEFDRAAAARDTTARDLARSETLHQQGMMSDEEFETVRREAEDARQTAAMAELQLSRTVIRAPFAGRILVRHVDAGANVTDGTAVFEIADLDPLYADVDIPERHIARLEPGQSVRLSADASGASAEARIERIAPLVQPETGTVKVTLAVARGPELRPGSFVRVAIVTDTHERALVVPRSALVADGRRWYLFRVGTDGNTVEKLEVGRGYEEQERVEIMPSGGADPEIGPGDRVVVVGASALTDGASIRISPDDSGGGERAADREDAARVSG